MTNKLGRVIKPLSLFTLVAMFLAVFFFASGNVSGTTPMSGDTANTHYSPVSIPLPLEARWSRDMLIQKPVVDGYTVYASELTTPTVLHSLELASGREKWEYRFADPLPSDGNFFATSNSIPAVKNGIVYAGSKYYPRQ